MKKVTLFYLLILIATLSFFLSHTALAQQASNEVLVQFLSDLNYEVLGDTSTNKELSGSRSWHTRIINTADETGEPITDLQVSLNTELAFDLVPAQYLTRIGPPAYEWSFDSTPEVSSEYLPWLPDACIGFTSAKRSPFAFTPGFDVSRSANKTVFSGPDTQTVIITITPRENIDELEKLSICVHPKPDRDKEHFIDAHITSVSTLFDEHVVLSSDGYDLDIREIPLEINVPWECSFSLNITPKVPKVEYMPYIAIGWGDPHREPYASGTTSGKSISFTNDAGNWIVSGKGNYVWSWIANPAGYSIGLHRRVNCVPELTSGRVSSPFLTALIPCAFEVTYTDVDDKQPTDVRIYIDGSPMIMDYKGGKI